MRTTQGLLVFGSDIEDAPSISLDASDTAADQPCPIARAASLPVYVRRLPMRPLREKPQENRIVRIMSRPETGLADMEWQAGGCLPPAPPVHMFRNDGVAFTRADFNHLDDFEMQMLDDGPRKVTRGDWQGFAELQRSAVGSPLVMQVKYPKGASVMLHGLQTAALNGEVGVIAGGVHYSADRVGIQCKGMDGVKAFKPANIKLL